MQSHRRAVALFSSLLLGISATAAERDLLVSSRFTDNILRYDGLTGDFLGVFASGNGLDNPNGIAFGPDGSLYVAQGDAGSVLRFDSSGGFLGTFVAPGFGGLADPRDLAFGPDGNLYVCSGSTGQVLRFAGGSGDFLGVAAEGHGLDGPVGLTFGPDGHLFVGGALSNAAYEFDNGNVVRSFTCPGFSAAVGVIVDQGILYVAQSVTGEILRYDLASGSCLGALTAGVHMNIPIYMTLDPNGDLLVGVFGNDSVRKFDLPSGASLGQFVLAGAGGLDGTHDLVFTPEPAGLLLMLAGALLSARETSRRRAPR